MGLLEIKKALLEADWGYAIEMVNAIDRKARSDAEYSKTLTKWLNKGGTATLRNELCYPFKQFSFVTDCNIPLAFDNMWMSIDSASTNPQ